MRGLGIKTILVTIEALSLLFSVYEITDAFYVSSSTGFVEINTDAGALITVSQTGHKSSNVGSGHVRIRLKPGQYELTVSKDRAQSTTNAEVVKQKVVVKNIPLVIAKSSQGPATIGANSLIKLLPFSGPNYEYLVSYIYDYSESYAKPIITITSPTDKGRQDALAWISHLGFDPSKLDIHYSAATGE